MSSHPSSLHFRTRAIHVGNQRDPQTGAVVPPLHLASTFVQPGAGQWGPFDYSRSGNPTRKALETTLASLESGTGALAFSSGMAATHGVTMLLGQGDHVVAGSDIYGGTYRLLHKIVDRAGIEVTLAPSTGPCGPGSGHPAADPTGLDREPRQPAVVDQRHRGLRRAGPCATGPCWASIRPSPRPCSPGRWNWGPTSSCTPQPSTSAGIAICWAGPWWSATGSSSTGSTSSRTPPAR